MMSNNNGNNDARQDYADMERENRQLRGKVIDLEDEVAKLRDMASTLWNYTECMTYTIGCPDDVEPCEVCAAGRVVESWEE